MNRELRKRHLRIWIFLGPILVAGVVAAILLRPPSIADHDPMTPIGELP